MQKNQKQAEAGERKKEKHVEFLEREGRLEGLRRLARRRMGLHMMPKDSRYAADHCSPELSPAIVLYNLLLRLRPS